MRAALPLMKNVLTPLAKSVLMLLALTKAVSATDTSIQKKTFGWGRPSDLAPRTTTLIISNKKMDDIMKIVKSFEQSDLLIKGVNKTTENEAKEQKRWFVPIGLGTFAASVLGNMLAAKGIIRAVEGVIRAGQEF